MLSSRIIGMIAIGSATSPSAGSTSTAAVVAAEIHPADEGDKVLLASDVVVDDRLP
jgi:hypothetical protein